MGRKGKGAFLSGRQAHTSRFAAPSPPAPFSPLAATRSLELSTFCAASLFLTSSTTPLPLLDVSGETDRATDEPRRNVSGEYARACGAFIFLSLCFTPLRALILDVVVAVYWEGGGGRGRVASLSWMCLPSLSLPRPHFLEARNQVGTSGHECVASLF